MDLFCDRPVSQSAHTFSKEHLHPNAEVISVEDSLKQSGQGHHAVQLDTGLHPK